ncbi:aspartate aminotransferase family protein [Acetobacteraceae bacterium]|nr:aspartate aminotransferase family protein [Acetobacteraceae bacterium]
MSSNASCLTPNYNRFPIAFTYGKGVWLFEESGQKYLDFGSGIAVSSLGHSHPKLVKNLQAQAAKLLHVSNLYHIPEGEAVAEILTKNSFADYILFANSGTEANEALVKIMRRAQFLADHEERKAIITFSHAFHGRTLAMLSATGNPKYQEGFGTMPGDFRHAVFNDIDSVKKHLDGNVAGILIEPIQGESGINMPHPKFLQDLRLLCDENGIFLGFDEVQTGIGRSGHLFAYEHFGVTPDILSLAKGLGGGIPIGTVLVKKQLGDCLTPGTHGSTFAGNPFACIAAKTVLEEILSTDFLPKLQEIAQNFSKMLAKLISEFPDIFAQQKGIGLLKGLRCIPPVSEVVKACLKEHLLVVPAGDNVLRLLPPLTVSKAECKIAIEKLSQVALNLRHNTVN